MSDIALLLGPIAFRDFELPSGVNFGGRQHLAVHRLPTGARVVDTLGRDDAEICFTGIFTGPDATMRARSVDEMRVSGLALPLTWDVFFYTVLIAEFCADYRNGWWIPYYVRCTVLQDEASSLTQLTVSLASTVLGDIGSAVGYASDAGLDLSGLQATLTVPGATTLGTAAFASAQADLIGAQSSIAASAGIADATLTAVEFGAISTAEDGISGLSAATDASGQLASLVSAGAFVRRAAINLGNASS
ncbi:MAG TPA: hypothetical protein VH855_17620 [Acetobacteraceae bacterium]|jgi:hypothetical protein